MEYLAIFDEDNRVIPNYKLLRPNRENMSGTLYIDDKEVPRSEFRPDTLCLYEGQRIKVCIIWIENNKGEFLVQFTSPEKGSRFSTTGGHCKYGDTALDTIVAEVYEELGVSLKRDEIQHLNTVKEPYRFVEVFYIKKDLDIDKLKLQKEEVERVEWANPQRIKELIDKEMVIKSHGRSFVESVLPKGII